LTNLEEGSNEKDPERRSCTQLHGAVVKRENAHIQNYSNNVEKRRCFTIDLNTLKRMNSCVVFIILRNNFTITLQQLEVVSLLSREKNADFETRRDC
jgi:hypothetical protein